MNEKNDFALVPRPASTVEKTGQSAKRVLSGMVADTLALVKKEPSRLRKARFRIGNCEWCEPDYRQIMIWARALNMKPEAVIRRLRRSQNHPDLSVSKRKTRFRNGRLLQVCWDFDLLPLEVFDWVDGLAITHLSFAGESLEHPPCLSLRIPSLMDLHCACVGLDRLDLSAVPNLQELDCGGNNLTELDLSAVPNLQELDCGRNNLTELDLSAVPNLWQLYCRHNNLTELDLRQIRNSRCLYYGDDSIRLIQRPDQDF